MDKDKIAIYIGSKIKEYRKLRGMTQEELGKHLSIGKSTIANYEKGFRSPKKDMIFQIAEVLSVSIDDLFPSISQTTLPPLISNSDIINNTVNILKKLNEPRQEKVLSYSKEQLTEQQQENIIQLREWTYKYYDDAASAGTGQYLTDGVQETIKLPVEYDADFVIPICGDSMEPIYHDWDYVFIETTYDLYDGDIGVFILDGDAYIKELRIDEEGAFLHSLNPKYRDKPILPESDFRIVGKVIGRYNPNDEKEVK